LHLVILDVLFAGDGPATTTLSPRTSQSNDTRPTLTPASDLSYLWVVAVAMLGVCVTIVLSIALALAFKRRWAQRKCTMYVCVIFIRCDRRTIINIKSKFRMMYTVSQ